MVLLEDPREYDKVLKVQQKKILTFVVEDPQGCKSRIPHTSGSISFKHFKNVLSKDLQTTSH